MLEEYKQQLIVSIAQVMSVQAAKRTLVEHGSEEKMGA